MNKEMELLKEIFTSLQGGNAIQVNSTYHFALKSMFEKTEQILYPRLCDATGKGMDQGYYLESEDMYFSEEKYLINHLRSKGGMEDLSDEFILGEAHSLGEFMWTTWFDEEKEDGDTWYTKDGEEIEIKSALWRKKNLSKNSMQKEVQFTEEQINHLADNYADGKSSSSVFRDAHKKDFIAGFNKALSLCAVIISACECTCSNSLSYSNCDKKCKRYELEQADL